jgi:hypothetical protein
MFQACVDAINAFKLHLGADWPAFWQTLHQSVQVKLSTTFSIQPD